LKGSSPPRALAEAVRRAGKNPFDKARLQAAMASMTDFDVGGFRINLRAGVRDSVRAIDLVTIRPDGKVVR
jgi:branched-chain amino acid transport system substrate-binding protein